MAKGIIVVDIPDACLDCRFCREIDEGTKACCTLTIDEQDKELFKMIDCDYCQEVPKCCPIKPLPEKKKIINDPVSIPGVYTEGIHDGWNKCIDEILKGEYIE